MKPAETVAVAVAIPMILALIIAEVAAGRPAPAAPTAGRVAEASDLAPVFFDEIVVVAKRTTEG